MKSIAMAGMVLLIFATYCHCEEFNPFCYERFDGLRKMQFWGEAKILISDYDRNSGDAYALKLIKGKEGLPNDSITDYFNNGFVRLIKGSHPYVSLGMIKGTKNRKVKVYHRASL